MAKVLNDFIDKYKSSSSVEKLICWIVATSVLMFILKALVPSLYEVVFPWLALSSSGMELLYKPYTLISYSFVHAGAIHLLLNMLVLYLVSKLFTTYFTAKDFLVCFFLGAFLGGVFFIVGSFLFSVGSILVGASAAIICPLMALVFYNPNMQIRLMLIGVVKIWYIAAFIVILDIIQLSGANVGGHLAHLGGACMGFLYIKFFRHSSFLDSFLSGVQKLFKPKKNRHLKTVYKRDKVTRQANNQTNYKASSSQKQIDEILEKISKSGYESLTKEEKNFLFTSGKK